MSEDQWMMFNWTYSREPGTFLYNGNISQIEVTREGDVLREEPVKSVSFDLVALEWMLTELSLSMEGVSCRCKVVVFLTSKGEDKEVKVWELDEGTVELIRHNLPGAIHEWRPRHIVVHVRPFVPSLCQEKVNAES